jgi:hypothetical protein
LLSGQSALVQGHHFDVLELQDIEKKALQVLDEKWTAAEADLSIAFKLCDPNHTRNAGAILSYLLPVQILRGRLPRKEMLQRYGLMYFEPIIEALKVGNPVQLQAALDKEQIWFMRVRDLTSAFRAWLQLRVDRRDACVTADQHGTCHAQYTDLMYLEAVIGA